MDPIIILQAGVSTGTVLLFATLGEIFAGGFLGTVFFCISYYILAERWAAAALLVSLPQALAIGAILSANNACDMVGDRIAGRRTLALVLGKRLAPWAMYLQSAAGLACIAALAWAGLLPALSGLAALPAAAVVFRVYRRMGAAGFSHDTKGRAMAGVSAAFLMQSAAVAVGLTAELF